MPERQGRPMRFRQTTTAGLMFRNARLAATRRKARSRPRNSIGVGSLALLLTAVAGCPRPPTPFTPPVLLTRDEAIRLVNENTRSLKHGLRSRGLDVRAELVYDGQRRHYDFRGLLTFVRPNYLFLQLDHLTQTAMRIGSNADEFWVYVIPEVNKMWLGKRNGLRVSKSDPIPVHPDQLIESLGLNELPTDPSGASLLFTVDAEFNRLVFVDHDIEHRAYITKEYELDRRPPFLIQRIVFRWPDGTVAMRAFLKDYQPLQAGTMVARHVRIEWPQKNGFMDMRFGKTDDWGKLSPKHASFRRPKGAETIEKLGAGL